MSRFNIIQADPYQFKNKILEFWEKYLPGTPFARFEWLANNPAGPTIWLFAIEKKTGKLAGTISLFPKDLFYHQKKIKTAILGDFMLHEKFRVFGPALDLIKAAVAFKERGEFDFLYTIPNPQSRKIAQRVGFNSAGKIYSMMHPLQCDLIMEKYLGHLPAKILRIPASLALNLCSRTTYVTHNRTFMYETDWNELDIDNFCSNIRIKNRVMTGDCGRAYLRWRYGENPESEFRILCCRQHEGGPIKGLSVFSVHESRMELFDIMAVADKFILMMLKKIESIAKNTKCRGIYFSVHENNPLLPLIRSCCFFDTKDMAEIYVYPEQTSSFDHWAFTSADRNI